MKRWAEYSNDEAQSILIRPKTRSLPHYRGKFA